MNAMSLRELPIGFRLLRGALVTASVLAIAAALRFPRLPSGMCAVMVLAPALLGWRGSVAARKWWHKAQRDMGPRPSSAGPPPVRPVSLDRPILSLPAFHPPKPHLPTAPTERLPGQWTRCNVCHRPLTDPTSRWRGIGPDCFQRHNVHWPQGPVNPDFRQWERDVERLRR